VGLLGLAFQLWLLALLTRQFQMPLAAATLLAVETAVLHNFLWHERFTWRDRSSLSFRQRAIRLLRFHAGNGLVSLFGNTLLNYCLVDRLHAPVLPSAICAVTVCSMANFLLAERWVYESRTATGNGTIVVQ
jgi:dolichol-phosphate mannosyltransferase